MSDLIGPSKRRDKLASLLSESCGDRSVQEQVIIIKNKKRGTGHISTFAERSLKRKTKNIVIITA